VGVLFVADDAIKVCLANLINMTIAFAPEAKSPLLL